MRTIIIPDVDVVREDWEGPLAARLANPAQLGTLWLAVKEMHQAAKDVERLGRDRARVLVAYNYAVIREILCQSPAGALAPWPQEFWRGSLGRLIYYSFVVTHGDGLMTPKQVATILGVDTPRLGQLQQLGMIDYLVDADAEHPRRETRRVTRAMLDDYLAHRASPRAKARHEAASGRREGEM